MIKPFNFFIRPTKSIEIGLICFKCGKSNKLGSKKYIYCDWVILTHKLSDTFTETQLQLDFRKKWVE